MIELFFAPTPNGWKVTVMLEECELPYRLTMINIAAGEQFQDTFLAVSPNAKIPAIRDSVDNEPPISIFETGAILQYLAEKTGKFLSADHRTRYQQLQQTCNDVKQQGIRLTIRVSEIRLIYIKIICEAQFK